VSAGEAKFVDHQVRDYWRNGITVQAGDIVFDVGANIGLFGIRALQRCPSARIFAFEPSPPSFAALEKNRESFDPEQFRVFGFGISDRNGSAEFSSYSNTTFSTFNPEIIEEPGWLQGLYRGMLRHPPPHIKWMRWLQWLPDRFLGFFAERMVSGKRVLQREIRTLSSLVEQLSLSRIDLLKVDCEGDELRVFRGITPEDWPKIRRIVVEIHDIDHRVDTIKELLTEKGFNQICVEAENQFENLGLFTLYALR
jgi:hypothetical protein